MARQRTTKPQVSGEIWHNKKYNSAAVHGLPASAETAKSGQGIMLGGGIGIVALGAAIAFIIGMINPSPEQGDANIMATQSGGLYVKFEERLHPVTNMASARLITGQPDKASVVKETALAGFTRGPLMGIPSAPSSMEVWEDSSASWGVCDWQDTSASLSLTNADTLQTTLVAGRDTWADADTLGEERGVIVRPADAPTELWMLFGSHRAQIGPEDFATHAALGITQADISNAQVVSRGLLNAIETLPVLTAPDLFRMGETSPAVPRYEIGDVIVTEDVSDLKVYFAVTDVGVQRIPRLVADLLVNKGATTVDLPSPAAIANLPQAQRITLENYPESAPTIERPASLCYAWSRPKEGGTAATHIVFSDRIPVTSQASESVVSLLPSKRGSSEYADYYASKPGRGWYVRVTGNDPESDQAGQIAYITDSGVRHNLVPDDSGDFSPVVEALGLGGDPLPIPDSIARMYPIGPDLSQRAALVQHVNIPVDLNDGEQGERPARTNPNPTDSENLDPAQG